MRQSQDQLSERLGYRFKNPELLESALTHRSFGRRNNERLEFLGDALLTLSSPVNCLIAVPSWRKGS